MMVARHMRIAVDTRNPPFSECRGEAIEGFSVDVLKAAYGHMGIDVDCVPEDGLAPQLLRLAFHSVDAVLDLTVTAKRRAHYAFSQRYYLDHLGIMSAGKGWVGASLAHFRGKAAVKAYSYAEEWVRQHYPLVALERVDSTDAQLDWVKAGRAVALITGHDTIVSLTAAGAAPGLSARGSSFAPAGLALATLPDDAEAVIAPFDAGLAALVPSGEWASMRRKWMEGFDAPAS